MDARVEPGHDDSIQSENALARLGKARELLGWRDAPADDTVAPARLRLVEAPVGHREEAVVVAGVLARRWP